MPPISAASDILSVVSWLASVPAIFPQPVPRGGALQGQVLNQTSAWWFKNTGHIVQNAVLSTPVRAPPARPPGPVQL